MQALLEVPTYKKWWALSELYKQITRSLDLAADTL